MLDLFLTDDANFVQLIQVKDTKMSDHRIVKIFTYFFQDLQPYAVPENLHKDEDLHICSSQPDGDNLQIDFTKHDLKTTNF